VNRFGQTRPRASSTACSSASVLLEDRIIATDANPARRKVFADRFRVETTEDNRRAVSESFIILLRSSRRISIR